MSAKLSSGRNAGNDSNGSNDGKAANGPNARILEALDDPFFQVRRVLLGEQHFRWSRMACGNSMGRMVEGDVLCGRQKCCRHDLGAASKTAARNYFQPGGRVEAPLQLGTRDGGRP